MEKTLPHLVTDQYLNQSDILWHSLDLRLMYLFKLVYLCTRVSLPSGLLTMGMLSLLSGLVGSKNKHAGENLVGWRQILLSDSSYQVEPQDVVRMASSFSLII